MRVSRYFLPILKEDPQEASIVSHKLMLRAGLIKQLTSGIYNWLPLGYKVLRQIESIIREEMNATGAIELLMPTIQPANLWQESGRYDDYGKEMLRVSDRQDRPMLYGPTNEEVITDIFRHTVKSYKDLPLNLYQMQWKFRDEIRPRFGVMRGREFYMKDAYSFDIDEETSKQAYKKMFLSYIRTFRRMGLTAIPVRADTGAIGGNLSHEFQVLAETGESALYYDKAFDLLIEKEEYDFDQLTSLYAAADEMHNAVDCPLSQDQLHEKRGIEVGHVFHFGMKYSQAMQAKVTTSEGKQQAVYMGSYGIGVSRLVGAVIEAFHDEKGIVWPRSVAPFTVGLINVKTGHEACDKMCEHYYQTLQAAGVDVLFHDQKESAGSKFATMDLIGLPWQVIIGPKSLEQEVVELKCRKSGERQTLSFESACNHICQ